MVKKNLQKIMALGIALSMGLVPMTALAAESEVPNTQAETTTEAEVQEPVIPRDVQMFGDRDYSAYTDGSFSNIEFETYNYGGNFVFRAEKLVSSQDISDKFFEILGQDKRYDGVFYGDETGVPYTVHYNDENGVFHELTLYNSPDKALNSHSSGFPDFIGFPESFVDCDPSYYISQMTLYNDSIYLDGTFIGQDPKSTIKYKDGYPLSFDKEAYLNADGTLNETIFESELFLNNTARSGNAVHYGNLSRDVRGEYAQEWYAIIDYEKKPYEVVISNETEHVDVSFFPLYMGKAGFSDKTWEEVDSVCTYNDFTFAVKAEEGYILDRESLRVTVKHNGEEYVLRSWINDSDFGFNLAFRDTDEEGNEVKNYERVEVCFNDWNLVRAKTDEGFPTEITGGIIEVEAKAYKDESIVPSNPDPGPTPDDNPKNPETPDDPSNKDDIDTDRMSTLIPITVGIVGTAAATGYVLLLADKKKKKIHGIWSAESVPGTKVKGKKDLDNMKMWFVPEIAKDTETKAEAVQRILGCEVYTLFPEDTKFSLVTAEGSVSVESEEALYNKFASMEGLVSVCIDSASKNIHLKVNFNN